MLTSKRFSFLTLILQAVLLLGCSSGKEVLLEQPDKLATLRRVAIVGFPGQCTHEGRDIPFLQMAFERFDKVGQLQVVPVESTLAAAYSLRLPPIYVNDEYSTLDVQGIADLCIELNTDAIIVGFYRAHSAEETTTTPVSTSGDVEVSTSHTYVQTFPTFEVCIIDMEGSLLFRGIAEGRSTGFWNAFWDSLFKSESDETFHDRVQDALDGICELLED